MTMNLIPYLSRPWLCEPLRLQGYVQRAISTPCFSSREVVEEERAWRKAVAGPLPELSSTTRPSHMDAYCVLAGGVSDSSECDMMLNFSAQGHTAGTTFEVGQVKFLGATDQPKAIRAVKGKVGVIPIHGPVDQRMSSELMKTGGTPLDYVSAAFDAMIGNASIGAIVLHIDSPGGGVYGTQELADKIYAARGTKPIFAMIDSMAASAAYWICTAAGMVVCTPGGESGGVGVFCIHYDESMAMEKEGIKPTIIAAGKYKAELAPTGPLSADAIANLQESVDGTHEKFLGALKRNRATNIDDVRRNYGQGRVFSAEKALAAGMIDRILTMDELMSKLTGSQGGGPSASALKMRHEYSMQNER